MAQDREIEIGYGTRIAAKAVQIRIVDTDENAVARLAYIRFDRIRTLGPGGP